MLGDEFHGVPLCGLGPCTAALDRELVDTLWIVWRSVGVNENPWRAKESTISACCSGRNFASCPVSGRTVCAIRAPGAVRTKVRTSGYMRSWSSAVGAEDMSTRSQMRHKVASPSQGDEPMDEESKRARLPDPASEMLLDVADAGRFPGVKACPETALGTGE